MTTDPDDLPRRQLYAAALLDQAAGDLTAGPSANLDAAYAYLRAALAQLRAAAADIGRAYAAARATPTTSRPDRRRTSRTSLGGTS